MASASFILIFSLTTGIIKKIKSITRNKNKKPAKILVQSTTTFYSVYKKHIYEIVDNPKKQPNRRFLRNDLALKVIIDPRTDETCTLKRSLRFNLHDIINTKEQTVLKSIKDGFEGKDIQIRYSALGDRIDLYCHEYRLAIEIDELGYNNRSIDCKFLPCHVRVSE